jgi:hypothetical protein
MNRREFQSQLAGWWFHAVLLRNNEEFCASVFFGTPGTPRRKRYPWAPLSKVYVMLGNIDGQTMTLDNRFPNEEPARFKLLATELVASRPDVLITVTRQAAIAAKQETTAIPPLCARPRRPVSASFRRIAVSLVLAVP